MSLYIFGYHPQVEGEGAWMTNYFILPLWLTIHSPLLCGLLLARCQYLHRSSIVWVGHPTLQRNSMLRSTFLVLINFPLLIYLYPCALWQVPVILTGIGISSHDTKLFWFWLNKNKKKFVILFLWLLLQKSIRVLSKNVTWSRNFKIKLSFWLVW